MELAANSSLTVSMPPDNSASTDALANGPLAPMLAIIPDLNEILQPNGPEMAIQEMPIHEAQQEMEVSEAQQVMQVPEAQPILAFMPVVPLAPMIGPTLEAPNSTIATDFRDTQDDPVLLEILANASRQITNSQKDLLLPVGVTEEFEKT